jgi:two-component system response regulator WspF
VCVHLDRNVCHTCAAPARSLRGCLLSQPQPPLVRRLKTRRNQGHSTIAQDEATSAVYGMPKAAATLDAAVEILPVTRIAAKLTELACV